MSDELIPEWLRDQMLRMNARFDLVAERWAQWVDIERDTDEPCS